MNTSNEDIDNLLGKAFKKAGLSHPSPAFAMKVMERVEKIPVKQRARVDWELWGSMVSIISSIGIVAFMFPGFFSYIFMQTRLEQLLGKLLLYFQNAGLSELFSGSNFLILITSLISTGSLIFLDKIFNRVKNPVFSL